MSELPDSLNARVAAELRPGERLIWVGQPIPELFAKEAWSTVFFGVGLISFMSPFLAGGLGLLGKDGIGIGGLCFSVFLLMFILVGVRMLFEPSYRRRRARATCYVLTDQRAILFNSKSSRTCEIRSFLAVDLPKMFRRESSNGTGDLVFEEFRSIGKDSEGDVKSEKIEHGFLSIANVHEVETLVRKTLLSNT